MKFWVKRDENSKSGQHDDHRFSAVLDVSGKRFA